MGLFWLLVLLVGCKGDDKGSPADTGAAPDDTGADETGETADTAETGESGDTESFSLAGDVCEALVAGPAGGDDPVLEFSRMHAGVRLFRTSADWQGADQALVDALAGETWEPSAALALYGEAVGGCVAEASALTLPSATVTLSGEVAIVQPGTGAVEIPAEATAVVLDLRGLSQGAETEAALEVALAAVLSGEVSLGQQTLRIFSGFPGAVTDGGTYGADEDDIDWVVTGTLPAALPLVVWTERALPPEAARVAGALRMNKHTWLVGHPVWAGAAEASWSAVGDQGLLWPSRTMLAQDEAWPDIVPADLETDDPASVLDEVLALGNPGDVVAEAPTRLEMERFDNETDAPLETLDRGAARAMLMTAHGLLDRFYPYFDIVGYDHDEALLDGLAEVDALAEGDRAGVNVALGRFLHVIEDGHAFFGDWVGAASVDNYLLLQIEDLDGWPVVRSSGYDEVSPGDTIIEIDGVEADLYYEERGDWHSAATPGYLFEKSGRDWLNPADTASVRVRSVDGEEQDLTLSGLPYDEMAALVPWGGTLRPSGWLTDLGADTLYFLNLNFEVTTDDDLWQDAIEEAAAGGATGLVVDMRDYPAINHYSVAKWLRTEDFFSPTFRVKTWTGPDSVAWVEESYDLTGRGEYTGPIVLLVSNKTVSAAENFSMMLWGDDRVTVVGQQSAGTNGNITATYLPGGYYFYFTGMSVRNPDGSELHGVGIPLDVEVVPTPEDYADGIDPELMAAIEVLSE